MQVRASRLGTEMSITLINDDGQWRFGGWRPVTDRVVAVDPWESDRTRRFNTPTYALAYFRARYPEIAD
jgi:hypothetical protein